MPRRWPPFIFLLALTLALLAPASLRGAPVHTQRHEASSATSSSLDARLEAFEFAGLDEAIKSLPASTQRDYFEGILANREGKPAESALLLEKALAWARQSDPQRNVLALETLADDYVKTYRYSDAVRAYTELFQQNTAHFPKAQRQDDEDDFHTLQLLQDAPPQTIQFNGKVVLSTHRNSKIGTIDTDLTVNRVTASWIIDTGANFSTVSESFARQIGAKLSAKGAQTEGITGAENPLHIAILPELKLGGAIVRNVVLLVLPDANLNVPSGPKEHYQIQAVLGYPVLQALGRFTLTKDGQFLAGPESPQPQSGAPLYMYKLTPLLECTVTGKPLIFAYDTGADKSAFSDRYYRTFPEQFRRLHKRENRMGGAGGTLKMKVFFLPEVELGIGNVTATLHHVPVLPDLGTNLSKYYGNLGRDLTSPYDHFTIDFVQMRMSLGTLQPASSH